MPDPALAVPDAASQLQSSVDAVIASAPELQSSPGATLTVAQAGGNVPDNAQSVAQAGRRVQTAAAAQSVDHATGGVLSHALGWLGHNIAHPLGTAIKDIGNAANAPLRFVQHEYRYFHDVAARYGMGTALAEGLVVAGGIAAGSILTGGLGDVLLGGALAEEGAGAGLLGTAARVGLGAGQRLGAAAGAGAVSQVMHRDSWQRTGQANYRDPHTGNLVSFGRDLAGFIGLNPKNRYYNFVSGTADASFDIFGDPLGNAGQLVGKARSVEGFTSGVLKNYTGLSVSAENVERAYQKYGSVRRAIDQLAAMKPEEIIAHDPRLVPLVADHDVEGVMHKGLGSASTPDEVMSVFRDDARAREYLSNRLPTLSLTRAKFSAVREAMDNADQSSLLGKVGRMTTRIPGQQLDPVTLRFSGKEVDPTSLKGAHDFYLMMRYGLSKRAALQVMNHYVNADVATRINIFRNGMLDMLLSRAGIEYDPNAPAEALDQLNDPKLRQKIGEFMDEHATFAQPDAAGRYGSHMDGSASSAVWDPERERAFGAGTMLSHTGTLTIPEFHHAVRMAQELAAAKYSRYLGSVDDFAYDHFTRGFFKKWVLQSLGYAEHIALAELIPNSLRIGFRPLARRALEGKYAHLSRLAENPKDMSVFEGWAWRMMQHTPKALMNQRNVDWLAEMYALTENHIAAPALAAGEYGESPTDEVIFRHHGEKVRGRPADVFTAYGPESDQHIPNWQIWLRGQSRDPMHKAAAQAYIDAYASGADADRAFMAARDAAHDQLQATDPSVLESYQRSKLKPQNAPAHTTPLEDWASEVAENVRAATHSPRTERPNEGLLDAVANGLVVAKAKRRAGALAMSDLKAIDLADRPLKIPGRLIVPDSTGNFERVANLGFRKVLNPVVNFLARQPIAASEYIKAREALEPMVQAGNYSVEEAATIALARSTSESMRYVHNVYDRTQFDQMLRNIAPFFFAQEQAYRRYGRLLAENPGAFRRAQLAIAGVHNYVSTVQSQNGNYYIAFPGSGFLGAGVPGILGKLGIPMASVSPAGFGGTLSSANVVFPLADGVRPNLGPVAIIPAQLTSGMFAELGQKYSLFAPVSSKAQGVLNWAVGGTAMSRPVWEQLVPNLLVQRAIETASGDDRAFNSAMIQTLQNLDYQQNVAMQRWIDGGRKGNQPDIVPPPNASPLELQTFVNKVKNQTRILFGMRAILGVLSPISADVMIQNYGFPQELTNEIQAAGGNVTQGVTAFLAKNPLASPYTTFQSKSSTGESLPSSVEAQNWIDSNKALINRYQYGALWLMPQLKDTKYNAQVYNEQIAEGLRVKDTPIQFLEGLYTTAGDQVFYDAEKQHQQALASAGHDAALTSAEYNRWTQYTAMLAQQMPIWASNFNSNQRLTNAQRAITELQDIYSQNLQGNSTQAQLVGQLLDDYGVYLAKYQKAGMSSNYSSGQAKVRKAWESHVEALATQSPQLKPIVTSVFKNALLQQVSVF